MSILPICFVIANLIPIQETQTIVPTVFGPGVISTGANEFSISFDRDGKTAYFTRSAPDRGGPFVILQSHLNRGRWSTPEVAPFSGQFSDGDPFVSPDGNRIFFMSQRPLEGNTPQKHWNLWAVERKNGAWQNPTNLGSEINGSSDATFPSVSANGTLYFASDRPGGKGENDIYRSRWLGDHYSAPENLGDEINTEGQDANPLIAPDESYLIFFSDRPGGFGGPDLYISFNEKGHWTKPRNLGPTINTGAAEFAPAMTPDGKGMCFTSTRRAPDFPNSFNAPIRFRDFKKLLNSPGNGVGDIYWVDIRAVRLTDR